MQKMMRSAVTAAGAACVALSFFGSAVANASSSHESNADVKVSTTPPQMELSASTGEQIRTTGTQGVFANADQCTDSSTTTKVACVTPSSQAAPQLKAK
jgi:hypothetical protein